MSDAEVVDREAAPGSSASFDEVVASIDRPLRQALVGALGVHRGDDAHAAALAWAWEHQDRIAGLASPIGYLYKVGRSAVRYRRKRLPVTYAEPAVVDGVPEFEPALASALAGLPERQRVATFLVVGCGWPAAEVGRLIGISESTVRAHAARGVATLREALGADDDEGGER